MSNLEKSLNKYWKGPLGLFREKTILSRKTPVANRPEGTMTVQVGVRSIFPEGGEHTY